MGLNMEKKPAHVGPFDRNALRLILSSALQEAERRSRSDEVSLSVVLVRDAMWGGGQGVAILTKEDPVPEGSELVQHFTAPGPLVGRAKEFFDTYLPELQKEVEAHPDMYLLSVKDNIELVARRMVRAFLAGSANKDSRAIRRTCSKLGIKYTYQGIRGFLESAPL